MEVSTMENASQPTQLIADDSNMQSRAQLQTLLATSKATHNINNGPPPVASLAPTPGQPVSNGSPSTRNHLNNNNHRPAHADQPEDPNNNQFSIVQQLVERILDSVEAETRLLLHSEPKPTQQQHSRPNKIDQSNHSPPPSTKQSEKAPTDVVFSLVNNHQSHVLIPQDETQTHPKNAEAIDVEETKEMVMLRNLEISPPPPIVTLASSSNEEKDQAKKDQPDCKETLQTPAKNLLSSTSNKRRKADPVVSPDLDSSVDGSTGARSKRQRIQTKLFQAGHVKASTSESFTSSPSAESPSPDKANKPPKSASKKRKKSTIQLDDCSEDIATKNAQSNTVQENFHDRRHLIAHDHQDVIFYEKNDYLAIRNEENSFYLCQLTENVRVVRPMIKVKWLDTKDDGKTYFLTSHYDKVPHKSIIMPVGLNKMKSERKGQQLFTLDHQDRENIMERLKRSLNATVDLISSQDSNVVG